MHPNNGYIPHFVRSLQDETSYISPEPTMRRTQHYYASAGSSAHSCESLQPTPIVYQYCVPLATARPFRRGETIRTLRTVHRHIHIILPANGKILRRIGKRKDKNDYFAAFSKSRKCERHAHAVFFSNNSIVSSGTPKTIWFSALSKSSVKSLM